VRGIQCKFSLFIGLLALVLTASPAAAQDRAHDLFKELHLATTPVTLGDGVATQKPGPDFAYLSPADAEVFLTQIWITSPAAAAKHWASCCRTTPTRWAVTPGPLSSTRAPMATSRTPMPRPSTTTSC